MEKILRYLNKTPYVAGEPGAMKTAIERALLGRCPKCGGAPLFRAYLKQVDHCAACAERFGHIRADDAAPWLTILLVGHVFLPAAFLIPTGELPVWAVVSGWSVVFALVSLAVLPVSKALFITILWATRAPGSEAA